MRLPILSAESSVPVRTANTPGIAAAASVSIFPILAWACGERRKYAWDWPGRSISAVKRPLPVMKRWSSLRRTAAPIPVALMAVSSFRRVAAVLAAILSALIGGAFAGIPLVTHGPRPGRDGLHDIVVAGATTEIAF